MYAYMYMYIYVHVCVSSNHNSVYNYYGKHSIQQVHLRCPLYVPANVQHGVPTLGAIFVHV